MRLPRGIVVAAMVTLAVVIQTTLFQRIPGVAPDLVMLLVITLALTRVKPELTLVVAFLAGLLTDLLGSLLLGLRAVTLTVVAYAAVRTRDRAEIGRAATAIWAGLLSLAGVALMALIGAIFGEVSLLGPDVARRMLVAPLANLVLAALLAPLMARLVDGDSSAVRLL